MSSYFDTEIETAEYDSLAKLAENMVFRLPGCADVMIRKCLASAYRDFCKRTCALKTSRTMTIDGTRRAYRVAPMISDCIVDCVLAVFIGRNELEKERYSLNGDFIVFDRGVLPKDDETAEVRVECVEIPKISSEVAPQSFIDRHGDAITSGALSQLFAMTNRPWSDPAQAMACASEYENALTECRVRHHAGGELEGGSLNFIKRGCLL